ncbi:endonuclease domain-containing protein, partial [Bradyrhizobium uaiense]|uniref:endonuclease domain-containing protein n=1 Tax=Bradyrhizobium uaiense TaxID=2594946 RepID=UPI0032213BD5
MGVALFPHERYDGPRTISPRQHDRRGDLPLARIAPRSANGFSFRKQHPIGPYTVDFYCSRLHLAVEVDGGQHAEQRKQADDRRTQWLAEKGVTVVRYWNNDVLSNLEGVLSDLVAHIERLVQAEATSLPPPPPFTAARGDRRRTWLGRSGRCRNTASLRRGGGAGGGAPCFLPPPKEGGGVGGGARPQATQLMERADPHPLCS